MSQARGLFNFGGGASGSGGGSKSSSGSKWATALGTVITFIGFALKKGGFATGAPLPHIPRAQQGLMTKGAGPIPAILHPDEVVLPLQYIKEFFGLTAERLFKTTLLPPMPMPAPAVPRLSAATGGGKSIQVNLHIGAGNFDDPSYWRDLVRTKINPALEDISYGRVR
jgi:hypothetical protein